MTTRVDVQESSSLLRGTDARRSSAFPIKPVLGELLGAALLSNIVAMGESPLHIGLSLAAIIFSLGHVSGAHLNPAVSLAVFVRGRLKLMDAIYYAVAQIVGAFLGGLIAVALHSDKIAAPMVASGVETMTAVSVEALYTMVLSVVVLNVATSKAQSGNGFYGLAIGLALTVGASIAGPISGGALNPALGIALPVLKDEGLDSIWIYIVGPLVGSLLAAGAFYLTAKPDEFLL